MVAKPTQEEKPVEPLLPGETLRSATAFLLYCTVDSLHNLEKAWLDIYSKKGGVEAEGYRMILGKPVAFRTLEKWSSKFNWVARKSTRQAEITEEMKKATDAFIHLKKHQLSELFNLMVKNKLNAIRNMTCEDIPMSDLKHAWEMFRMEAGESTSKTTHDINHPTPRTPEETEEAKKLNEALGKVLDGYL